MEALRDKSRILSATFIDNVNEPDSDGEEDCLNPGRPPGEHAHHVLQRGTTGRSHQSDYAREGRQGFLQFLGEETLIMKFPLKVLKSCL